MFDLFTGDAGTFDLKTEREIWEGLKHSSFLGDKNVSEDEAKARVMRGLSPERSKSDLIYSPSKTPPVLQRSYSSPVSDRSEISNRSRSRPTSEVFKSYRPLQNQLNHLEGEAEMIREQTEISHYTEQSQLSHLSEKVDGNLADIKSSLPTDIAEGIESQVDGEDIVEGQVDDEVIVNGLVEGNTVLDEAADDNHVYREALTVLAEIAESETDTVGTVEVETIKDDSFKDENVEAEPIESVGTKEESQKDAGSEKSNEIKLGVLTPNSFKTPSQSVSVIDNEDTKGIPRECSELSIFVEDYFLIISMHMFTKLCFEFLLWFTNKNITHIEHRSLPPWSSG